MCRRDGGQRADALHLHRELRHRRNDHHRVRPAVTSRPGPSRDGGRVVRRALVTVALLLLAAGGWWLWPATLGGGTTYLVTQAAAWSPGFTPAAWRSAGPPAATPSAATGHNRAATLPTA